MYVYSIFTSLELSDSYSEWMLCFCKFYISFFACTCLTKQHKGEKNRKKSKKMILKITLKLQNVLDVYNKDVYIQSKYERESRREKKYLFY